MERDQCQLKRAPYFMSSVRTWERLPNRRWMHWESRSKLWMRRSKLVSIQRNRWNVSMRKPKSNKNWKIKRRKPKDFRKNKKKKNVSRFQWWCILSLVSRCIWRVSKGISSFVIWLLWSPRISRLEQLRPIRQFHQLDFHRYHRYHQPVMDMEQCHLWALLVQLWIQELHWLRVIPQHLFRRSRHRRLCQFFQSRLHLEEMRSFLRRFCILRFALMWGSYFLFPRVEFQ